jgi:hypothetical protein
MNDEPTSDALSRASAYLDGELGAAEIGAVEADPEVMAEVARLRELQASIRDVAGPNAYARDMAVATALDEFDRRRHPAPPVVRPRPRPAYSRWLAVAAAVAGLAALGAVITTTSRGGDDSDQDAAGAEAAAEESAVAVDDDAADRAAPAGAAPEAAQPESAQSQTALAATEAPPATALEAAADAGQEAPATAAAPETTEAASVTMFDPSTPIPDAPELGRVGRQLLTEWEQGARVSMTGTPCAGSIPDVVLLSDALLVVDGTSRPVLVAGNPATDETFALDPESCVVVLTGR